MKSQIRTLILMFLLLLNTMSIAQVYRYIEIYATENVTLKSTQIIYEISFKEEFTFSGMSFDSPDSSTAPKASIDGIIKSLAKGKFEYSLVESENYAISKSKKDPKIEVVLENEIELKRLYNLLKNEDGFIGKIKDVQYESIAIYQEELLKRLYENALQQATKMAIISGDKVGLMISVSETRSETDDALGYYEKLMKKVGNGFFREGDLTEKEENITMLYVFELL